MTTHIGCNTQEAKKLIDKGWVLKTLRQNWQGHVFWLRCPGPSFPGCAKYISSGVFKNLLKLGIKSIEITKDTPS